MVGAGVIGLATTAALLEADAGVDVTCFEAFEPMSQRSTGSSRIFRLAHQVAALVELAAESRSILRRWSAEFGRDLVTGGGTVVTGADVPQCAEAMATAGAEHELRDPSSLGLPAAPIDGPALLDPAGGVMDAHGIGEYLLGRTKQAIVADTVYRIAETACGVRVSGAGGSGDFDVVVIAAGSGTCQLAAQAGLYTPSVLQHHLRLTFEMADPGRRPPALIDKSETWRPGFTTYQHLTGPGRWAVGAHFDPAAVAWEVGRDRAVEQSRRLTIDYVRENLAGVGERVVDELYCNVAAGWADGYGVVRRPAVIAVHGDNLFKLAPVVGRLLAGAVLDGSLPESTLMP